MSQQFLKTKIIENERCAPLDSQYYAVQHKYNSMGKGITNVTENLMGQIWDKI